MVSVKITDMDRGYRDAIATMRDVNGGVRVGIQSEDLDENYQGSGKSLAEIANTHEFGGGNVPQRSFMRSSFDENKDEFSEYMRRLMIAITARKMTLRGALGVMGEAVRVKIHKKIRDKIAPANAPETVRRKYRSRQHLLKKAQSAENSGEGAGQIDTPLIDTGGMIQAIRYKVEK